MMLKLSIARGALSAMTQACEGNVAMYALGSDPVEYQLFCGGTFWARGDRPGMTAIYQKVLFSSMELSGAEHFDAPAEWQASVIAAFVHPANYMSACSWFGVASSTMSMSGLSGDDAKEIVAEQTHPRTLFALVLLARAIPEADEFRSAFEKHVNSNLLANKKPLRSIK